MITIGGDSTTTTTEMLVTLRSTWYYFLGLIQLIVGLSVDGSLNQDDFEGRLVRKTEPVRATLLHTTKLYVACCWS